MLQLILPALVKLDHHVPDIIWHALVTHVIDHLLLEFIGEDGERLGLWRRRDLLKKVVTECVLVARVLKEDGLWLDVEHTVVTLDYLQ